MFLLCIICITLFPFAAMVPILIWACDSSLNHYLRPMTFFLSMHTDMLPVIIAYNTKKRTSMCVYQHGTAFFVVTETIVQNIHKERFFTDHKNHKIPFLRGSRPIFASISTKQHSKAYTAHCLSIHLCSQKLFVRLFNQSIFAVWWKCLVVYLSCTFVGVSVNDSIRTHQIMDDYLQNMYLNSINMNSRFLCTANIWMYIRIRD